MIATNCVYNVGNLKNKRLVRQKQVLLQASGGYGTEPGDKYCTSIFGNRYFTNFGFVDHYLCRTLPI